MVWGCLLWQDPKFPEPFGSPEIWSQKKLLKHQAKDPGSKPNTLPGALGGLQGTSHASAVSKSGYWCTYGKGFKYRSLLLWHQVVHTEAKPFQCTEYGKTFKLSSLPLCHQLVHTEERPYQYSKCLKTF